MKARIEDLPCENCLTYLRVGTFILEEKCPICRKHFWQGPEGDALRRKWHAAITGQIDANEAFFDQLPIDLDQIRAIRRRLKSARERWEAQQEIAREFKDLEKPGRRKSPSIKLGVEWLYVLAAAAILGLAFWSIR